MRQNTSQTPLAGGVQTRLPQNPLNAGVAQNLVIDKATGGWSTAIGYEPFVAGASSWSPFGSCGPVYSLHVSQGLSGGARQHVLFEESGNLHLLYEAGGADVLRTLATGRNVPSPTEAGSWFTDTAAGTVVTNGVDRPVLVRPWPLGDASDSASTISQCIRPFGFDGLPTPPAPRGVRPYPAPPYGTGAPARGAGQVTLWSPAQGTSIPDGGKWGLGFYNNGSGGNGAQESLYSWSVSFITDTGSEGPASSLGTARWALDASAVIFRHAAALDIPTGPKGTVARKLYRTMNYSEDSPNVGDTTLYFLDVVRNNVDELYFDAITNTGTGQPAPEVATGPLPAPKARFSALFAGCLFLDGGINDPRTLYFSTVGAIEQFAADAFLELSAEGGGITAIYANYTTLLVFREHGIDVVQGDYTNGFTVTPLVANVTCRSPHSIASIPGLGVAFLAVDGVYAVTGGLQGGALNEVVNLTANQDDLISRITPDCLPKAVACFSAALREYQLWVPVDGNDRPNLGLVLHVDRLEVATDLSAWTTRVGFPVGAVSTLFDGTVVFGHNTGSETGDNDSQRGLFVISGKRALGSDYVGDVLVYNNPPTSIYRSAWNAFDDPQTMKQVSYVTLWVLTTGNVKIQMRHYKDFSLVPLLEQTYYAQPPDAASFPVLDTAILGKNAYRQPRLVPLRYSVAHQSAAWFCFEVETTENVVLVGYEYEWTTKGTRVPGGVRA